MISENPVVFGSGTTRIEGLFHSVGAGARGAVICHPHPLWGGEMRNSVVETLAEALSSAGLATLRFNFRGVGLSEGEFDAGRGEQEDLIAASQYLTQQGISGVVPAGYSFGAWITCAVLARRDFLPAVLVAPPIAYFPFDFSHLIGKVGIIICGERDPFCPTAELRAAAVQAACPVEVIGAADQAHPPSATAADGFHQQGVGQPG